MNNELYHHGIKGQRKGRRRWQNEDGTYTEAGKERYFNGKNFKKKVGGFVGGSLGFTAGLAVSNKILNPISENIAELTMADLMKMATPAEKQQVLDGMIAIGSLPIAFATSAAGTKLGKKAVEMYLNRYKGGEPNE